MYMHIFKIFIIIGIALLVFSSPKIRSIIKGYSETSVDCVTHNQEKVNDFSENLKKIYDEEEIEKTEAFFQDSIQAAENIKANTAMGNILNEACCFYINKNKYEKTLKYADHLYEWADNEKFFHMQTKALFYYCLSQMELVKDEPASDEKDLKLEKAKKISLRGLHLIEDKKIDDPILEGDFYYFLSVALMEASSFDLFQAEKMMNEAKNYFETGKDQNKMFQALLKLAHINFIKGEIEKAENVLLPLMQNDLNVFLQVQLDFILSKIEAAKGQIKKAIIFAKKARDNANEKEKIKINQLITDLIKANETQNDFF